MAERTLMGVSGVLGVLSVFAPWIMLLGSPISAFDAGRLLTRGTGNGYYTVRQAFTSDPLVSFALLIIALGPMVYLFMSLRGFEPMPVAITAIAHLTALGYLVFRLQKISIEWEFGVIMMGIASVLALVALGAWQNRGYVEV